MNSKAAPASCARRTRGAAPRPCPGCRSWSTDIWPGGESRADPSFVTRARVTPGCGNTYRKLTSASQLGVRNLTHRNNERNRTTDLKRLPALSEAQVQCRLSFRLSASYQPVRVLRGSAGHGRGSVYSTMVLLSAWRLAIALLIHPLCLTYWQQHVCAPLVASVPCPTHHSTFHAILILPPTRSPRSCRSNALKGDLHFLRVAELVQILLARKLDHRRRTTHENQRLLLWAGQVLGDHVSRDKARRVCPVGGRAVHRVPQLELLGVLLLQVLEHIADENVVLGLVGIEQRDLGVIRRVLHNRCNHLKHWRDSRAARHHA